MPPPHLTLAKPKSGFSKLNLHTMDIIQCRAQLTNDVAWLQSGVLSLKHRHSPIIGALHDSKRRLSVGHGCALGPSTATIHRGQGTPGSGPRRGEVQSDGSLATSHTRLESLDLDTWSTVLPLQYDSLGNTQKILLSWCRLLINMSNGLKLFCY